MSSKSLECIPGNAFSVFLVAIFKVFEELISKFNHSEQKP